MIIIGIDPGPTPGFVRIQTTEMGPVIDVVQCNAEFSPALLATLAPPELPALIAMETFVVGPRAGRVRSAGASRVTRSVIENLMAMPGRRKHQWIRRPAGQVKPWATDERLEAAGILDATKGMRHARDAGRHALYAAVASDYMKDPLSSRVVFDRSGNPVRKGS